MRKTTLVVMAAGIGSRFGGGIKQLEPVGPSGEIIMDYSVYDAIQAGFDKVVFIIRKDLEKDFREIIGNRRRSSRPHTHFRSWTIFRQVSKDRREGPNPGEPVRRFSAAKIWFRSRLQ